MHSLVRGRQQVTIQCGKCHCGGLYGSYVWGRVGQQVHRDRFPEDVATTRAAAMLPGKQKEGSGWGMACSRTEAQEDPTRQETSVHSCRRCPH